MSGASNQRQWTFLSNHGHILVYVAAHPEARIRDVADSIGLTERAAQGILGDLAETGYLTVTRVGRRNSYRINPDLPLRHPHEADHTVGELLAVFDGSVVG
jgi:predicted transcriptional regulator of viral defense system